MDMHYKTFATRNPRNLRFEQIRQTSAPQRNQPSPPTITVTPPSSTNLLSAPLSPRKRVNVVSFVPQGTSEVITKSPEKPDRPELVDLCTTDSVDPYSSQPSSPPIISSSVPICLPSKTVGNSLPTAGSKRTTTPTTSNASITETAPKLARMSTPPVHRPLSDRLSHSHLHTRKDPSHTDKVSEGVTDLVRTRNSGKPLSMLPLSVPQTKSTELGVPRSQKSPAPLSSDHRPDQAGADDAALRLLFSPKFKRVEYTPRAVSDPVDNSTSNKAHCPPHEVTAPKLSSSTTTLRGKRNGLPLTSRSVNTNCKPSPAVQSAPAPIGCHHVGASSLPSQPVCEKDPYEWADGEEEEIGKETPRTSVGDEESDDDGIKPWFWPATRSNSVPGKNSNEPTKPTAQKSSVPPSTNTTSKTSVTTVVSKDGKLIVPRNQKSLYTVVQRVKDAYECQERGEVQHALDDMTYLIDGLADTNSTSTRSLSILTLANKCLSSASRDLIHAYDLMKQVCRNLHDAHTDYSLGLTAAGLFFVLSRDRDPETFSSESLGVLLKLLNAPNTITSQETGSNSSAAGSGAAGAASKYSSFGASRVARLNKEAAQIRSRVQQLLESLGHQQNQRLARKAAAGASSETSPLKSSPPSLLKSPSAPAAMSTLFPSKRNGAVGGGNGVGGSPSKNSLTALFRTTSAAGTGGLNTRHLRMNRQLTAHDLVLESILNLGVRKAADWFKTGLRVGGGIDAVAEVAIDAVDYLKDLRPEAASHCFTDRLLVRNNPTGLDDFSLDKLKRVGYYAKLLENMTYLNPDNQTHLVRFKDRLLIDRLVQCIRLCAYRLPRHAPPSTSWTNLQAVDSSDSTAPVQSTTTSSTASSDPAEVSSPTIVPVEHQPDQQTLLTCLLGIFRLFVNISHGEYASDRLGGCPGLLEATLDCLFHLPEKLPPSRRFDLLVLILCLLANLCEHCPENRIRLVHLEVPTETANVAVDATSGNSAPRLNGQTEAGAAAAAPTQLVEEVGYDEDEEVEDFDEDGCPSKKRVMISALDEVVKLFLYRELKAKNHDFERDDDRPSATTTDEAKESATETGGDTEASATAAGVLQRPKPPPPLTTTSSHTVSAPGETIEEAGLKWRLIAGDRKASNSLATARSGTLKMASRKSRRKARRKRRRLALARLKNPQHRRHGEEDDEEEDDEDEEEEDEDDDESDYDEDDDEEEEEEEEEDNESIGSGADVEFVAETAEEQAKLAERMSSANQHMEDSVVAAYAALLLGCILQSSPRYTERIRARLPDGKFRPLAIMLAKLLGFLSLAKGVETAGSESILRIVRVLEAQDQPPERDRPSHRSGVAAASCPTTRLAAARREQHNY
nr:unnamed protein product [Spirometra erinaceieuropaei]